MCLCLVHPCRLRFSLSVLRVGVSSCALTCTVPLFFVEQAMQKLVNAPEDGVELQLFRGLAADLYNPQVCAQRTYPRRVTTIDVVRKCLRGVSTVRTYNAGYMF